MYKKINFLLIGNSRLHWAENVENNYKFFHTSQCEAFPKNFNINNIIWASVGRLPNISLKKENQIKTKDIQLINLPDYFGIDRAFASLAALKTIKNPLKKNFLIADFGTTLSITKLNSKGVIIGGQICPGFLTQMRSLEIATKNLNSPKRFKVPDIDFSIKTEEAIINGVLNSLVGLINLIFDPSKDILIICGGDSKLVENILKKNIHEFIIAPNLVMEGMISHFQNLK